MCVRAIPLEEGTTARGIFDMAVFALATLSASVFYISSQYELFRDWRSVLKYLPFLMALGIGICLSNTKALLEAIFGKRSEFVRTPKYGAGTEMYHTHKIAAEAARKTKRHFLPYVEFAFGIYMSVCAIISMMSVRSIMAAPFMIIFAVGFFYVSILSFQGHRARVSKPVPRCGNIKIGIKNPAIIRILIIFHAAGLCLSPKGQAAGSKGTVSGFGTSRPTSRDSNGAVIKTFAPVRPLPYGFVIRIPQ